MEYQFHTTDGISLIDGGGGAGLRRIGDNDGDGFEFKFSCALRFIHPAVCNLFGVLEAGTIGTDGIELFGNSGFGAVNNFCGFGG